MPGQAGHIASAVQATGAATYRRFIEGTVVETGGLGPPVSRCMGRLSVNRILQPGGTKSEGSGDDAKTGEPDYNF
jgi:hypothetical protein